MERYGVSLRIQSKYGKQPLTIITKSSTLDVAAALDPSLSLHNTFCYNKKGEIIYKSKEKNELNEKSEATNPSHRTFHSNQALCIYIPH